jgi:phage-related baseplate assembly protein
MQSEWGKAVIDISALASQAVILQMDFKKIITQIKTQFSFLYQY